MSYFPAAYSSCSFREYAVASAGERNIPGCRPVRWYCAIASGSSRMRVPSSLTGAVAEYRALYEAYEPADARYLQLHRGHFMFPRSEEERFLTEGLVRDLTTTGTAGELVERVRGLAAAGYQQLAICLAPGHENAIEQWARVAERV